MAQLWPPGEENINFLWIQVLLCISEAIPRYKVNNILRFNVFLSGWPICGHLEEKMLIISRSEEHFGFFKGVKKLKIEEVFFTTPFPKTITFHSKSGNIQFKKKARQNKKRQTRKVEILFLRCIRLSRRILA